MGGIGSGKNQKKATKKAVGRPKANVVRFDPNNVPAVKIGRPKVITDPKVLEDAINQYLNHCLINEIPLTMTGMAIACGLGRTQLYGWQYKGERDQKATEDEKEIAYLIRKARDFIEQDYEMDLRRSNPTGAMFALKEMGWNKEEDKSSVGTINIINILDKINVPPEVIEGEVVDINEDNFNS